MSGTPQCISDFNPNGGCLELSWLPIEIDLRDLGIDIAGQHAVYGQGATAVEIFAFHVTALEKEALYKRVSVCRLSRARKPR